MVNTKKKIVIIIIAIATVILAALGISNMYSEKNLTKQYFMDCAKRNDFDVIDKTDYAYSVNGLDTIVVALEYGDTKSAIGSSEYYKFKSKKEAEEFEKNQILKSLDEAYKTDLPNKSKDTKKDKEGNKQYIYILGDTTCSVYRKGNVIIFSNIDNKNGIKNYKRFERQLIPNLK